MSLALSNVAVDETRVLILHFFLWRLLLLRLILVPKLLRIFCEEKAYSILIIGCQMFMNFLLNTGDGVGDTTETILSTGSGSGLDTWVSTVV